MKCYHPLSKENTIPQFHAFETNPGLFEQVQVNAGGYGISWNDELELEAEEIWEEGTETGIYQADISKIERGLANPSVSTLQRLAEGMGMKLKIEFVQEEQR